MNEIIQSLLGKWDELSSRERWIVGIGAIIFVVVFVYSLVITPLWTGVEKAQEALQKREALLTWLQHAAPRVLASRSMDGEKTRETYDSVLSLLEKKAEDSRIKDHVKELGLMGGTGIRLTLDGVVFDDLIAWMWDLSRVYDVNVVSLTVNETQKPGVVNAELVYAQ